MESGKIRPKTIVGINDVQTEMQIDSGADVNTLTEDGYKKSKDKVTLVTKELICFLKKPLELLGKLVSAERIVMM